LVSVTGGSTGLRRLLRERVTAVQLMFTGCTATCPIQGALFAEVQKLLAGAPPAFRLLSISVDALGDDPKSLAAWLRRYGAEPTRWSAAVVVPEHVDALFEFVQGRTSGADPHTAQVHLFDRDARLAYRSINLPPPETVASLMHELARIS
jgi:protein SCO1/2